MSRPTRTERRAAERRRQADLEPLCRDLLAALRRDLVLTPYERGELLRRADEVLGPDATSANTNTAAHVTGERGRT